MQRAHFHRTHGVPTASRRLALIAFTSLALGDAAAQTCESPWSLLDELTTPIVHSTCDGVSVATALCSGSAPNPGPNWVFGFHVSEPARILFELAGESPGFDPVMYLSQPDQSCVSAACLAAGFPGHPIEAQLDPGTYFLYIGAFPDGPANACGAFALTYALIVPDDLVFADGFDTGGPAARPR